MKCAYTVNKKIRYFFIEGTKRWRVYLYVHDTTKAIIAEIKHWRQFYQIIKVFKFYLQILPPLLDYLGWRQHQYWFCIQPRPRCWALKITPLRFYRHNVLFYADLWQSKWNLFFLIKPFSLNLGVFSFICWFRYALAARLFT